MKKTSKTALRWLRVCHMLTAPLWFGGAAAAFVLLRAGNPGGPLLYSRLVLPAALLTVIVGLLYGACTPWGFFRFRWIAAKWALTLSALLLAMLGALWGAAPAGFAVFAGGAQAVLLAAAMVVAVLKPGGRNVVLFAQPKKERTDEELREAIERDRRPL